MNPRINLIFLLLCAVFFAGCSKNNDPIQETSSKKTIQGSVEKGPFVRGSTITIYELNSNLIPTGRSFKSEIRDDKGSFSVPDIELVSDYVQLAVNGYYFNEVRGESSSSPITLNAIANIGEGESVHVNVLSHLEEKRVRALISKEKKTFNEAKKQALNEIYTAFFVKNHTPIINSEAISLINGDENASILLGISAGLLNAAQSDNPTLIDAKLTELLSIVSVDIEDDGSVNESLKQVIKNAFESLNATLVVENIKNRYEELNTSGIKFQLEEAFDVAMNGSVDPNNPILEDDFWRSEENVRAAYNALLHGTIKTFETYFRLEGLYTNTVTTIPHHPFFTHQIYPYDRDVQHLFSSFYQNVRMANTIMKGVEEHRMQDIEAYAYKVYPYFALQYWALINFWGDPFYLDKENFNDIQYQHPRVEKKVVYDLLMAGLENALIRLDATETDADVARIAAARIAIYAEDYSNADKYLKQLTGSGRYSLTEKSQMHISNKEAIFGIDYNQNIDLKPSDYGMYGKGNYRSIIRYTEVLLLASEVNWKLNKQNESLALLNEVRQRNGKSALSATDGDFLSALHEEVKEDLKNEGVYFAFLKRNNLTESVLSIPMYKNILPIPEKEIMVNPMASQNPGY